MFSQNGAPCSSIDKPQTRRGRQTCPCFGAGWRASCSPSKNERSGRAVNVSRAPTLSGLIPVA